ncbi:MAG: sulfotransferase [Pseudomonadota bacterium]
MSSGTDHALLEAADAMAKEGNLAGAISALKTSLKAEPNFFQAWLRLSKYLFLAEAYPEAVQAGDAAERFDPLQNEFGHVQNLMQRRAFSEADRAARQMLAKIPGHPRAVFTIAHVAGLKNYPEGQVAVLQHGLDYAPANLVLRSRLVGALEQAGDYQGAIDCARTLVKTQDSFIALWTLVSILLRHGKNEELLGVCERARARCDGDAGKLSEVELVRGQILRVMGRREDSIAAYRACLKYNPDNAGAWWALADMKTHLFTAEDRTAIETLLARPETPQAAKCVGTFALAKASERAGDWDETMALYHAANALHPKAAFDAGQVSQELSARIAAFSGEALGRQADRRAVGPTPIFILGLPRSGSTLIEQILASHSQIQGTIEQPTLPSIARKANLKCSIEHRGDLLSKLGTLSPADLSELGQAYLDDGALFRHEETAFFTDKLPFNYRHIGLIHKILPHAIFIDARRNPLDCGFSLYKQHFPTGVEFSYGLENIGAFYNSYLTLMDHWDTVLPGKVLRVQHEHLVRAPETHIRALLDHIGVPFEPACLSFHENTRAVRTASSEQVRQPINTSGIGAWRNVEPHLEPLKAALGDATLARFHGDFDA